MNYLLSFLGQSVISGFSIAYRIQTFFIVLAISLGVSTGILFNRKIVSHGREVLGFNLASVVFISYIPLALILFFFKDNIVLIFTQDHAVQEVVKTYIVSFFIPYLFFCPVLSILCFFEQTGLAFKSFFTNVVILFIQLISGAIYLQYSRNSVEFFNLMALICLITSVVLIIYFYCISRKKLNLILSNGRFL
jgi:Na+-driven multidrug efflux pump